MAGGELSDLDICYAGGKVFSHMTKMFTTVSQEKCQNLKDQPIG